MNIGDTLNGYLLLEQIAEGGMGTVWKAKHPNLDRLVAIKCIRPELLREANARTLFLDEVKHLSQLHSPQVVQVIDSGVSDQDEPFMVTEFLTGCDLSEYLDVHGPPPASEVCRIGIQVLRALTEAHAVGIIHGDLKPSNIFLMNVPGEKLPVVKVLDFGVASLVEDGQDEESTLGGRAVRGSLQYMAPEQLTGGPITPASDLYTVGATLFRLLTNRHLFSGDSESLIRSKLTEEPPTPSSVTAVQVIPQELEALILSCLARRAEERPSSASALRKRLEHVYGALPKEQVDTKTTTAVDESVPDWLQSGFSYTAVKDSNPQPNEVQLSETEESRSVLQLDRSPPHSESIQRMEMSSQPLLPPAEGETLETRQGAGLTLDDSRTVEQAAPTIRPSNGSFDNRTPFGGTVETSVSKRKPSGTNRPLETNWKKVFLSSILIAGIIGLVFYLWSPPQVTIVENTPKKKSAETRISEAKAFLERLQATDKRVKTVTDHSAKGGETVVEEILLTLPRGQIGRFLDAKTKRDLCSQMVMSCRVPRNLDVEIRAPKHRTLVIRSDRLTSHKTDILPLRLTLKPKSVPKKK